MSCIDTVVGIQGCGVELSEIDDGCGQIVAHGNIKSSCRADNRGACDICPLIGQLLVSRSSNRSPAEVGNVGEVIFQEEGGLWTADMWIVPSGSWTAADTKVC